jgi:phage tail tube protein FII
VCGKVFKITHPKAVDKADSYGETVGAERTIKIKAGLEDEMYEDTLLHELLHAILYTTGHAELLEEAQEEALVVCLENGISQLYERRK